MGCETDFKDSCWWCGGDSFLCTCVDYSEIEEFNCRSLAIYIDDFEQMRLKQTQLDLLHLQEYLAQQAEFFEHTQALIDWKEQCGIDYDTSQRHNKLRTDIDWKEQRGIDYDTSQRHNKLRTNHTRKISTSCKSGRIPCVKAS